MDVGFREHGIMLRITADTIALTPPLIISDNQIDELIEKVKKCILAVA
jgi:beta-alanine--pyruvate transaminase